MTNNDLTTKQESEPDAEPPKTLAELLHARTLGAKNWAKSAQNAGWLSEAEAQSLNDLSGASSADLFAQDAGEPLVVALFGGTGVGKSSLLNRLVGDAIAKVGVIRPTSLEATVYVHESINFSGPERRGFQRSAHKNDARRNVVWVDMPDVDSTAAHNRELVLEFLPFVDVLVYVVSPERYRDEAPWALLSAHAERSAWVFVMNQIDRGQQAQLDDLSKAVVAAGFEDPLLFATSCPPSQAPAQPPPQHSELDQFEQLAEFIDSLAQERLREALQDEGRASRLRLLATQLATLTKDWPSQPDTLASAWRSHKKALASELQKDLVERLAPVAARMADGEAAAPGELWDDWATERVSDAVSGAQLDALEQGFSQSAVNRLNQVLDSSLAARGEAALRESVRASLAQPGTAFQRLIYSACGWLQFALPLIALLWVGWFVISGFYGGATGSGTFVAEGFALNAVLLIGLGFGLPWLLGRLAKPSPRKAAMLGVRRGLDSILEHIDERVQQQINGVTEELGALTVERDALAAPTALSGSGAFDREASDLNARLRRSG